MQQTKTLFLKEVKSELKNKYALFAILLQLLISVFIIYTITQNPTNTTWHALFYVVLIFGVIQNVSRSFLFERKGNLLYYKFIVDARAIVVSKLAYQFAINTFFLLFLFMAMNFFMSQHIPYFKEYVLTAFLFTYCCVGVFTFNSALAMGVKNSSLIALILSLPLLIPGLLISLTAASKCLAPMEGMEFIKDWVLLTLLAIIIVFLSVVLFKFIWKD